MRMLALLVLLLTLPPAPALAQEIEPPDGTRIASAQVSGLDLDRLSPGLQADIGKLAGSPLNSQQLKELAARIEAEQPRYLAAVRATTDADGAARVVFLVARIRDQGQDPNINRHHVVEDVEIRGVRQSDLSSELWAELQALAGRQLDSDEADRLETRMREALPDYEVNRRTVKGSQSGRIKLIFDANKAAWAQWLRFEPVDANTIYHSEQGWGANLPLGIGGSHVRFTPTVAIDVGDDLIEEYSGLALRVESRKVGTERLGVFFEWSTFDQDWRDPTLVALATSPGVVAAPYRNRMSVMPLVKFAITQQLSVGGGVRITELDPLLEPLLDPLAELQDSRMANAGIGFVNYSQRSRPGSGPRHDVEAAVTVSAGTEALSSDLVYERYVGQADYSFRRAKHEVRVSGMAGRIDGDAPLFERFSLGDSRTLRGWDKYDIAPAGGDRMFHTTVEYRYGGLGMFLDTGSVWDARGERRVRVSTGVTFNPGPVFFTLGFPVNTDEFRAVFTMGFRFSGASVGIKKY